LAGGKPLQAAHAASERQGAQGVCARARRCLAPLPQDGQGLCFPPTHPFLPYVAPHFFPHLPFESSRARTARTTSTASRARATRPSTTGGAPRRRPSCSRCPPRCARRTPRRRSSPTRGAPRLKAGSRSKTQETHLNTPLFPICGDPISPICQKKSCRLSQNKKTSQQPLFPICGDPISPICQKYSCRLSQLKCRAVRVAVPEAELQPHAVDKAVSNAVLHYARTIASWRERGQEKRADAHEVGA